MNKPPVASPAGTVPASSARGRRLVWGVAAVLLAAGGWWALSAAPEDDSTAALTPASQTLAVSTTAAPPSAAAAQGSGAQSLPANADSFLTEHLQQTFEDMLLEANAAGDVRDVTVLRQRLAALVGRYFPPELVQRATALLARYVDYRQALGQLAAPTDPGDPSAMRAALQARQRVRQQYFSPEEYEALFGQDERLDRYTVARLDIERQTQLSTEQKQATLKVAAQELTDDQRAQRAASVQHLDVQAQTAAFDSRNIPAAERHAQRSVQFGVEAANRLSELDVQERQWQGSLDQYAQASAAFPANPSATQREQLEQLRQQLFTPEQQLRVDAGLELRALNRPSPKN